MYKNVFGMHARAGNGLRLPKEKNGEPSKVENLGRSGEILLFHVD